MFEWLKRFFIGTRREPHPPPPPVPPTDAYLRLIETLAGAAAERFKAQLAHDDKVEELALKKHELEVANAAALAEARAIERKSKEELRERKRENANEWNHKNRKRQSDLKDCLACSNPGSPALTSAVIAWHHNGHAGDPPTMVS